MKALLPAALVAIAILPHTSRADKPAQPSSFKVVSANGKFVFVMIVGDGSTQQELITYTEGQPGIAKFSRGRYLKSGLYKNDGSEEPLWTVGWYAYQIHIAGDGVHLIRHGGWPVLDRQGRRDAPVTKEELKQIGYSIYAKDKQIRSYSIGELVDDPKMLRRSVSHFQWLKKSRLVEAKGQFEVETFDRNHIIFDLDTGKVVEKKQMAPTLKDRLVGQNIEPARKWSGLNGDESIEDKITEDPITTQAEFAKVWKSLRGNEVVAKVDFTKEFVRIWTAHRITVTEIGFTFDEVSDEPMNYCSHGPPHIPAGFSYAIGVFRRDLLDVVNGKVVLKESKSK